MGGVRSAFAVLRSIYLAATADSIRPFGENGKGDAVTKNL